MHVTLINQVAVVEGGTDSRSSPSAWSFSYSGTWIVSHFGSDPIMVTSALIDSTIRKKRDSITTITREKCHINNTLIYKTRLFQHGMIIEGCIRPWCFSSYEYFYFFWFFFLVDDTGYLLFQFSDIILKICFNEERCLVSFDKENDGCSWLYESRWDESWRGCSSCWITIF